MTGGTPSVGNLHLEFKLFAFSPDEVRITRLVTSQVPCKPVANMEKAMAVRANDKRQLVRTSKRLMWLMRANPGTTARYSLSIFLSYLYPNDICLCRTLCVCVWTLCVYAFYYFLLHIEFNYMTKYLSWVLTLDSRGVQTRAKHDPILEKINTSNMGSSISSGTPKWLVYTGLDH